MTRSVQRTLDLDQLVAGSLGDVPRRAGDLKAPHDGSSTGSTRHWQRVRYTEWPESKRDKRCVSSHRAIPHFGDA